jgi:hypothetical protein
MTSKITISNPCSEDWNQMKPTDRGAYCSKCQFDVIDFTAMQPDEIRAVLTSRKGEKTCANISTVQMDLVNTNYHLWDTQSPAVFKSKFLYACLLVFGMGLFVGCGVQEEEQLMGDVEPVEMEEADTCATASFDKRNGSYTLSTQLGMLDACDSEIQYNNYDAFGNYSVTTRLKNKLVAD